MIELITFGATELRRDGVDVRSVLSQPKRLALLVYLRLAAPGGFVARERLLGLFWPDSDDERARNALRQSLHFLRRSLGDEVVVSRAENEVGVATDALACDAAAFKEALDAGRYEDALDRYRGEFMPGFYLDESPELEHWIEGKRAELARGALKAAMALSERAERAGEPGAALVWARRAVALDPLGEATMRRLMTLAADAGERASALEVYDGFRRRLAQELELEPSPETTGLAESIRAGEAGRDRPSTDAVPQPDPAGPGEVMEVPSEGRSQDIRAVRAPGRRRSWWIPAALAAVAVAVWVAVWAWPRSGAAPKGPEDASPAVAVLPFLDMSPDGGRAYFADGVTEELLNVLARVPGLRVAARTSSFAYRDADVTVDSIGRALGVSHVVEGSVRTDGGRVRVTAQLIETRGGFHLWSGTYDRDLGDLFAVQDEISRAIVERMQIELGTGPAPLVTAETPDPEAHRLYLQGRHAWNRRTGSAVRSAIDLFQQAVDRDPGYARAWAGLASARVVFPLYARLPDSPWLDRAEEAALRAIALDSTLAEPHAVLGLRFAQEDDAAAEHHYREALRLNPNSATARHWYSIFLGDQGRYEDQLEEIRRAAVLDPLSPTIQLNVGKALLHTRQIDAAIEAYRQVIALEPGFGYGHAALAEALTVAGRHAEAGAAARRALAILGEEAHDEALTSAGYALAAAGDTAEALRIARQLETRAGADSRLRPGAYGPAQIYTALGDTARALEWLDRAVEAGHWGGRPDLPFFDPLRGSPGFRGIERRLATRDDR